VSVLIGSMDGGGAELSVLTIIESLLANKHRVDLVLDRFQGPRLSLIPDGVNLFVLDPKYNKRRQSKPCSISIDKIEWIKPPAGIKEMLYALAVYVKSLKVGKVGNSTRLAPRKRHFYGVTSLSRYLNSAQPDLLYANLPRSCYISILARRCSSVYLPIVWGIRSDNIEKFPKRDKKYFNQLIGYADRIHANSDGLAKSILKYIDIENLSISGGDASVTAIPNPFNTERILALSKYPNTHEWFKTSGNKANCNSPKVVLATGRLGSVKNFALLINAFSQVLKRIDARLVILGEGGERANLVNLACKLQVAHAVSMPGWVDNPYSFMAKSDLFVLSSNYEGFPRVLVEALICGCSVVSTDCPSGPSEILDRGRWGRLVSVDDESAMANAIVATLEEPSNRVEQTKRGMEFDMDTLKPRYENLFYEVVTDYSSNIQRFK